MKRSNAASHDPAGSNPVNITNLQLIPIGSFIEDRLRRGPTTRSVRRQQLQQSVDLPGDIVYASEIADSNIALSSNSEEDNNIIATAVTPNISSPPIKIRRMQVGGNPATLSNSKSVGDRLKEKQKDLLSHNTANVGGTAVASAAPSCSSAVTTLSSLKPREIPSLTDRQRNTVRVISQYLREIGLTNSVEALTDESGCREEDPLALQFREALDKSDWGRIIDIIDQLKDNLKEINYLMLRVTFIEELLKARFATGDLIGALAILQQEYPRHPDFVERRSHYGTMLASDPDYLKEHFRESIEFTDKSDLLEVAENLFPPTFLIPKKRLETIFEQAFVTQVKNCQYHANKAHPHHSRHGVLRDHRCSSLYFPNRTTQIITDHNCEVWVLKFSPNGKYLASGGRSTTVYIFKVVSDRKLVHYNRILLPEDLDGVNCISWSGDSNFIACGGAGNTHYGIHLVDIHKLVGRYNPVQDHIVKLGGEKFSVADFFPSPKAHRIVCADQKGNFTVFDVDHDLSDKRNDFEGLRVNGLYCLMDGRTVLAADTLNRIRSYNFETMSDLTLLQETQPILSFTLNHNEEYCLVTTKSGGIRMWCLETRTLVQTFFGSIHANIVVNACFGGVNEEFVASGSEGNSRVMIWRREEKYPIKYLDGHLEEINCVAWNPLYKNMIVSGSDDYTIRVWSSVRPGSPFAEPEPENLTCLHRDELLRQKATKVVKQSGADAAEQ